MYCDIFTYELLKNTQVMEYFVCINTFKTENAVFTHIYLVMNQTYF
jgi:hypothetical protein